jgi:hypothetical protein
VLVGYIVWGSSSQGVLEHLQDRVDPLVKKLNVLFSLKNGMIEEWDGRRQSFRNIFGDITANISNGDVNTSSFKAANTRCTRQLLLAHATCRSHMILPFPPELLGQS